MHWSEWVCVCLCAHFFYCQPWDDNNLMSGITTKTHTHTHTHTHTYSLNDERSECMFILWLLLFRNSCWWMTNQLMIRAREAERKRDGGREGESRGKKERTVQRKDKKDKESETDAGWCIDPISRTDISNRHRLYSTDVVNRQHGAINATPAVKTAEIKKQSPVRFPQIKACWGKKQTKNISLFH